MTEMLTPGSLVQARYRIQQLIGQGGFGPVYAALDERLERQVALKQLLRSGERINRQFEREARLLANLAHPALPRVTDHFVDPAGPMLVMDYIAGDDLAEQLSRRNAAFPVELVFAWGDQLLGVLQYLHSRQPPIIHRDIKPQNLKLRDDGTIMLLDFGLAKGLAGEQAAHTTASILAYTKGYAPLEQVRGLGTDARSDLYSLGATLYCLLTQTPPVEAELRAYAARHGVPDELRTTLERTAHVPVPMRDVLLQALAVEPQDRPAGAEVMRAQWRAAESQSSRDRPYPVLAGSEPTELAMQPVPAPPAPMAPVRQSAAAPARGRWPWLALGAGIALVAALAVVLRVAGPFGAAPSASSGVPAVTGPGVVAAEASPVAQGSSVQASPVAQASSAEAAPSSTGAAEPAQPSAAVSAAVETAPPTETVPSADATGGTGPERPAASEPPTPVPAAPVRIAPALVGASATAQGGVDAANAPISYDATQVSDGREDTAWRVEGNGIGQWLQLSFNTPITVSEIGILPGYAKTDPNSGADRFAQNRRVSSARFEFDGGRTVEAVFADQRALQRVAVEPPATTATVKMVILGTTDATHPDGREYTAVSELSVFGAPSTAPQTSLPRPPAASVQPAARGRYVFPVQPSEAASYVPCHHDYPAIDIQAPAGTNVVAVTDGVVEWISSEDSWSGAEDDPAARGGLAVAIVGDDGVRYYGSHLSAIQDGIVAGVRVAAGQLLGRVGNSGNAAATAPHLHFGISRPTGPDDWQTRRGTINPFPYLEAWRRGEAVKPDLQQTGGGIC